MPASEPASVLTAETHCFSCSSPLHPKPPDSATHPPLQRAEQTASDRGDRMRLVKAPPPPTRAHITRQRLPGAPGAGDPHATEIHGPVRPPPTATAPPSHRHFLHGAGRVGKRKEELSELPEGAPASSLNEGVGWRGVRVETKRERKEGERMSHESARRGRAGVSADAAAPQSPERSGCARPLGRERPGQRARKEGEEARSSLPGRASQLRTDGSVGAAVPSPDRERRQRPLARPVVRRRGLRGPPRVPPASFHAPATGKQLRRDAGPARGGRAGYLKRGESFRHSSKSTIIFILPLPPPRLAGGAG